MGFGHLLFGFSGRINRAKYWLAVVLWALAGLIAFGLIANVMWHAMSAYSADNTGGLIANLGLGIILIVLIMIPVFISGFAIGVKRLHDRNRSGWWILPFYGGPGVLDRIDRAADTAVLSFVLQLAILAVAIWGLVELGFLRGMVGPNQYGPDPLAPAQVPAMR
jgi:uncharacterized membrane protein YhaH (DUF805 family)